MERRTLLGAVGGVALSAVAAVDLFAPGLIVGGRRGEGDPISTERTVPGTDVEYLPERDAVRWPALVGTGGDIEEYETEPFEDWASREAASAARTVVPSTVRDRIGHELEGVGYGVESEFVGLVVSVSAVTSLNRDGEATAEPNVSVDTLVDATPRSVEATVRLDGREYTRRVPAFVGEAEVAEL